MNEQVEILKSLKTTWQLLKLHQASVTRLEKQLKTIVPSTELTVWNNSARKPDNEPKAPTVISPADATQIRERIIRLCETRGIIESVTKEHFPEYNSSIGVGQILNLLVNNK